MMERTMGRMMGRWSLVDDRGCCWRLSTAWNKHEFKNALSRPGGGDKWKVAGNIDKYIYNEQ